MRNNIITYAVVPVRDRLLDMRGLVVGNPPSDQLERRFCALLGRFKAIADFATAFDAPTEAAASVVWGIGEEARASAANVSRSKLLKNTRDLERTLTEKEREVQKMELTLLRSLEVIPA